MKTIFNFGLTTMFCMIASDFSNLSREDTWWYITRGEKYRGSDFNHFDYASIIPRPRDPYLMIDDIREWANKLKLTRIG